MKKFIFEITINTKYTFYVTEDSGQEARRKGREFYLKNNLFTDQEIKSISSQIVVDTKKIVNL